MARVQRIRSNTFEAEVDAKRLAALQRMREIPIAALIWGPAPKSKTPVAKTRLQLRDTLVSKGHLARFSEELVDPKSKMSIFLQQAAQVEAYDIVFSIPDSAGSIAEIHDFARIPSLSHKIIAFLNKDFNGGYANKSLVQVQSSLTCQIQFYTKSQLPSGVINMALGLVDRLRESLYVSGRRV
jgi:hypothetical protein